MSILLDAASRAGVEGSLANTGSEDYGDGFYGCTAMYVVPSPNGADATKTGFSLVSSKPTIEAGCQYPPLEGFTLTSFHGFDARTYYRKGEMRMVNDVPYTYERKDLEWCMYAGDRTHHLAVWTDSQSMEAFGPARDPIPIAEALLAVAQERLPLSDVPGAVPGTSPGEDFSIDPGAPVDTRGLFDVPLPIALGSLGIPFLGAVSGTLLAIWLGGRAGSLASAAGVIEAGATLTSSAQEPSVQLVAAGTRIVETAGALNDLAQSSLQAIDVAAQKAVFRKKFDDIIKQKLAEGYYIKNADFAKDPDSPEWFPAVKDVFAGSKGGRCGEAAQWGRQWLEGVAKDTFGPETYIDKIDVTREGYFERWDVNHRSLKLIISNGERLVPDVHESLIKGEAVVYDEKDWVDKYVRVIGGRTNIERSDAEDRFIRLLRDFTPERAAELFKASDLYTKNPAAGDLMVKSYTERPPADPPPVATPSTPPKPTSTGEPSAPK